MKHLAMILLGLCLLSPLLGCGSTPSKVKLDAEDQFLLAMMKFDNRKYIDAQTEFQKLLWDFPGSEYVDEAQFYLAECYFHQEDYPSAIAGYTRLLNNYSHSPFSADAQFKIGLSYCKQGLPSALDQDFTLKAIRELRTLLEEYPTSDNVPEAQKLLLQCRTRLAKKEYDTGHLYYRLGEYASAIIYYEELIENYPETKWADDAQFGLGECYRRQEKWDQALKAYLQVLEMGTIGKLARRAQQRIESVEKKLQESQKSSG
jgi:outer membrane protein assembly factor BamD